MEDVESERRDSRRKRKVSTRQGVVIGVVVVAGLGLVTKLVSFLRREKPKKIQDSEIETLEAVLSGDAAKSALPPTTAEVHMYANLENDEADHEVVNGHQKDADSVPEPIAKTDDTTQDGEMHASQDLVADANAPTTEESESPPVTRAEVHVKDMPHSNGEQVEEKQGYEDPLEPHIEEEGKHHVEDAAEVVDSEDTVAEDAGQIPSEDAVELQSGDEVKSHIEDAVELHREDEAKQLNGDALEALVEDAAKLHTEDEGQHHGEDAVELQTENEARPHSGDAIEQLVEDAGNGTQSIEDVVKLQTEDVAPTKVVEQHQVEDESNGLHSELQS